MSESGMKKWVAYRALVEQASALSKTKRNKTKIDKPKISNERAEEINYLLTHYNNEEVKIEIYEDGFLYEVITHLKQIDPINRCLVLENRKKVPFSKLINITYNE